MKTPENCSDERALRSTTANYCYVSLPIKIRVIENKTVQGITECLLQRVMNEQPRVGGFAVQGLVDMQPQR